MDIKEIALKLQATDRFRLNVSELSAIEFAEALVAELAKQNEPCAFLHEWIEYHPFGDTHAGKRCAAITSDEKPFDSSDTVSPLFTFPPTAEQIANETAEACAKLCESLSDQTAECELFKAMNVENERVTKAIRSGAWKEFKK